MPEPASRPKPGAVGAWLRLNLELGLLSFVPASRAFAYHQRVVTQARWLDDDEFSEALTISQLLPGPNLVNLSAYLGLRLFGAWPALFGLLALALPGAVLAVALASLLPQNPEVDLLFSGFALGGVGLMAVFLHQLAKGLETSSNQPRRRSRTAARWLLIGMVSTALIAAQPLGPVVAIAVLVALLIEFC